MELLATALRSVATMVGSPSSESTVDPLELQSIEPTRLVEMHVAAVRRKLAALEPETPESVRHRGEVMLDRELATLEKARQRDAIQATRPDGCWCFGLGGRGVRYIPTLDGGDAIPVLDEYCCCPEAESRRARDGLERGYYRSMRREHRAREVFSQAGVPPRFGVVTFESYPISTATRSAVAAVKAWCTDGSESLLIYGPYGTGKTGLAVAAMRQRVAGGGLDALFLTTPALLDRIRETYSPKRASSDGEAEASEADVLSTVKWAGLLVLDDIGAERPTDWVQEKLFGIINHRHDEMLPTIFTSNLSPEGLAQHLGERIAWRIIEMSTIVRLEGPNLRDRA